MGVFFVAVILHPTEKQKYDEGTVDQIIVQPAAVIAKDESQAAAKAMRLVPEEHSAKVDRLEVAVLPFSRARA